MTSGPVTATGLTLEEGPIDQKAIDVLRALAAGGSDRSGDADTAMLAPLLYTLWQRCLRFDPEDPFWPNRDRLLVCSARARPLLRAVLHLAGVKVATTGGERLGELLVTREDLENPGRCAPESGGWNGHELVAGAPSECLAASARLAVAARQNAERFNRPGFPLFDHDVVALCSEDCLGAGGWRAAATLAASRGLSNLRWVYAASRDLLDPRPQSTPRGELAETLRREGWNVSTVTDGGDTEALAAALEAFRGAGGRPTLILWDGAAPAAAPVEANLRIPPGVREHFRDGAGRRGKALRNAWSARVEEYRRIEPSLAREVEHMWQPSREMTT